MLPPTTDPRIFFQIAAALIPALVFGGLLSDRFQPPHDWSSKSWRWQVTAVAVGICGLAVFAGEVTAIEVGLIGSPNKSETWLVACVVVGLTALTVASLVWPWVRPIVRAPRSPGAKWLGVTLVALLMATTWETLDTLANAVTSSQQLVDIEAVIRNEQATDNRYSTAHLDKILSAYAADAATRRRAGLLSNAKAQRIAVRLADDHLRAALLEELTRVTGKPIRLPEVALVNLGGAPKGCGKLEMVP